MIRKHESYGGFQPLELKLETDYYASISKHVLKYNSAKAALNALLCNRSFSRLYIPYYLCPNVCNELESHSIQITYYHIDNNLLPILDDLDDGSWVYIVDYFGVMDERVDNYMNSHSTYNFILDNCHSFFHNPNQSVCIYSCKKFFGVPDGAYLITDDLIEEQPELTSASYYSDYLLKCLEEGTNSCYERKKEVDALLGKNYAGMSRLADLLMHSIDYDYVKKRRISNADEYEKAFNNINKIKVDIGSIPYMYPLNIGKNIKSHLIENKIFVPTLWKHCLDESFYDTIEYDLTENTIFLPVDQRYDKEDILYIISIIKQYI